MRALKVLGVVVSEVFALLFLGALLLLISILAGCGTCPCSCRDAHLLRGENQRLRAQVEFFQRSDLESDGYDRLETLEDAQRSAAGRAHPEREAREGKAAFELNELQDRLEGTVKP